MPELLAFAEMCQQEGRTRVGLRVWRQVQGALQLTQLTRALALALTLALTLALSLTRSRARSS